jgi:serine/threonine protein kinase
LKVLGKGSFGEVFLVRKRGEDRLLAMKVLSKARLASNNLKRYAMTERNVMSALNHPFMVKLAYAFQSPTRLFLVMDYYPGGDLGKAINKHKGFSEEETRKYIC